MLPSSPTGLLVGARFRLAFAALVAAASLGASAQTLDVGGRRCAVPNPTLTEVVESVRMVEVQRRRIASGAALRAAAGPVTIPVAFHVITKGMGVDEGNVPQGWIEAQVDTLNATFASAGYRFVLAVVERVRSEEWYDGLLINSDEEEAMMTALALDPARYLNVYTARLGSDYLGWATVPNTRSEADPLTGVVLLDQSLPGGRATPYHLGHTGTHEVGHWMGLYHTFQGGCSAPNDGVGDTPQERSGASDCPQNRDSCPDDPGLDPVHNYMDYSSDACMTGFTAGQNERIQALVSQFRPTLTAGGIVIADIARSAFDDVPLGRTSTAPVAVTNLRDAPVTLTAASSTNPAFEVGGLPLTVAPGEVATLAATFRPAEAGPASAVLTLEADAGGPLAVSVVATAGRLPSLRVATERLEAEAVEEGRAEATVTLANDGSADLTFAVETVQLPAWIASVSPTAGTVAEGEAVAVVVQLSAAGLSTGTYETTLTAATNDPAATQVEVPVSLVVLARPEARLDALSAEEPLRIELIENAAAEGVVVLANDGAGLLSFTVDEGSLPDGVVAVSPASGVVAPGGDVRLTVSFASAGLAIGGYPVALPIQTNDPFQTVVEVPVALTVLARPGTLAVLPVYPNPGRAGVTIPLEVPVDTEVRADVFDARGRHVATLAGRPADRRLPDARLGRVGRTGRAVRGPCPERVIGGGRERRDRPLIVDGAPLIQRAPPGETPSGARTQNQQRLTDGGSRSETRPAHQARRGRRRPSW